LTISDAIILGLVEGITEYLPISSTGHLIIAANLLDLNEPADVKRAVDAFTIVIQGGAIAAVLGLYFKRVRQMVLGLVGRDPRGRRLLINLFVAFLPAAVLGPLLHETIVARLFFPIPVMAALAIWGLVMVFLTGWQRRFFHDERDSEPTDPRAYVDIDHLTWRRSLIIGLLQCVAMWPGTSRSLMTIVGGMVVGLRPRHAAQFSFLLGVPTLGGACVYTALPMILDTDANMIELLGGFGPVILGFAAATVSAALAMKWFVGYLSRHGVAIFGWYRLALAVLLGVLIWSGDLTIPPSGGGPPPPAAEQALEEAGRVANPGRPTAET
jgi:undecaprenyl-diphosphatase